MPMLEEIRPGSAVEGTDLPVGSVEQVVYDDTTRLPSAILVRHGPADFLLSIPIQYIADVTPGVVKLSIRFDEVESTAIRTGRAAPDGEKIAEGHSTTPSPRPEDLLGEPAGEAGSTPTG